MSSCHKCFPVNLFVSLETMFNITRIIRMKKFAFLMIVVPTNSHVFSPTHISMYIVIT